MKVLDENRSLLLTEKEKHPFNQLPHDTSSKGRLPEGFHIAPSEKIIILTLLSVTTDISSVGLHAPSLFANAIGSSASWQEHSSLAFSSFRTKNKSDGEKKLAELKIIFDPSRKKDRVERASGLFSSITPIEGIERAMWKDIVEEIALEDTYGD